jgi:hypothetical protein
MLTNGTEYVDQGQDYYEKQYRERVMKSLKRRAASLGFNLVPNDDNNSTNDPELSMT